MLYYNQISILKGKGINNTNGSYECKICHCTYFFRMNFNFQYFQLSFEPGIFSNEIKNCQNHTCT